MRSYGRKGNSQTGINYCLLFAMAAVPQRSKNMFARLSRELSITRAVSHVSLGEHKREMSFLTAFNGPFRGWTNRQSNTNCGYTDSRGFPTLSWKFISRLGDMNWVMRSGKSRFHLCNAFCARPFTNGTMKSHYGSPKRASARRAASKSVWNTE